MSNYKIISKRNPIKFLEVEAKFRNVESVDSSSYFIVDADSLELFSRNPQLFSLEKELRTNDESELIYDAEIDEIRLKTEEEKEAEAKENIDNSFHCKNYKITSSLPSFFTKFQAAYIVCKENENVITESERSGEDTIASSAYTDKVSAKMRVIVQANPDLVSLTTNPARVELVEIAEALSVIEVAAFIEENTEEYLAILSVSELNEI